MYLLASFNSDDNHWVMPLCVGDDFKATSECGRNVNLQGEAEERGREGRRDERGGGERREAEERDERGGGER